MSKNYSRGYFKMGKGYRVEKMKDFIRKGEATRRLALIKGVRARDTPLNQMLKELKLSKEFVISSTNYSPLGKNEVILERYLRRKRK